MIANLVLGLGVSFVTPFLPLFATDAVGMGVRGFGAFMTVNACSNIAIGTWIARRSDRLGNRKQLLLLGGVACALGYLCYAVTRELWALCLVGMFVLGVGSITFSQLYAHTRELLAASTLSKSAVPLYINTCRMAFALAWTGGPALASWLLARSGFGGLFTGAAALHVLFCLVVALGVQAQRVQRPVRPIAAAPPHIESTEDAPQPDRVYLARWFVAFALLFAGQNMALMNLSLLVLKVLGGDETDVGIVFSLAPFFEVPLMIYVGWLATRMPSARLIRAAAVISVLYYSGILFTQHPWHVYPLQILSAAIISVMGGVAITFFQDHMPGRPGEATNLYTSASRVGATSGYLLFGAAAGSFGFRAAYGVCAILAAIALLLMPTLRNPRTSLVS